QYRVYAQAVVWDMAQGDHGTELFGSQQQTPLTLTLSSPSLDQNAITNLGLGFDTGQAGNTHTADPTIKGTVNYNGDPNDVTVEFSKDNRIVGTTVPDAQGH